VRTKLVKKNGGAKVEEMKKIIKKYKKKLALKFYRGN